MTCRCPACDQVLLIFEAITPETILCCERCDRGFRAKDTRCEQCSGPNPFVMLDTLTARCSSCGCIQHDGDIRLTA